jgi:hypothetical protein
MARTVRLKDCEELISTYTMKYGGFCSTIEEGVLGLGKILLHSAIGKKSIIINEVYVNQWSSAHTVRMYNKLPKKYEKYTH